MAEGTIMKLDRGTLLIIIGAIALTVFFTVATSDWCYVGNDGNLLGYGSCSAMIDAVVNK